MKLKSTLKISILLGCIFLTTPLARGKTTVLFATLEWEPYIGTNLPEQGYLAQLAAQAFKNSDYKMELSFLPWARVVHVANQGEYAGYFPEYYSDKLQHDYLLSDPIPGGPLVLFKRKKDAIHYATLDDLQPYTIGVVRGYINSEEFDRASFLKKEETISDLQNFQKLIRKRIDLVVADKYVGLHILRKNLPEHAGQIDYLEQPLEEKQLYLCISKRHPDAEEILHSFNTGLARMRRDGSLQLLLDNFHDQNTL